MTADLIPFDFHGSEVRVITIDGEPWFVAADVAAILGYREAYDLTRGLDDDEKGPQIVRTPGGDQSMTAISEGGLYSAILRARVEAARPFRRWVTAEVLPAIRRHGGYLTPAMAEQVLTDPDTIIRLATDLKAERQKRIAAESLAASTVAELEVATPKARAWETFLSASGDMSVADAAKALARADVVIGATRLFRWLIESRWCYRGSDSCPRAMQDRIDAGHLRHKEQGHYHPTTGEWVIDAPQVRVTPRGLELLARRVGQKAA
jgi:prophage antirepressor-like protein